MNILSLFDGISCGQQALKELGVPVEKYYASEIDKYAISITQHNFPETVQLIVDRDKSKCVRSSGRGSYDRHEWDSVGNKGTELHWRKLTPLECERLQTLPDNYTAQGGTDTNVGTISNTQRYKALSNGWTVEVIKHIYKSL